MRPPLLLPVPRVMKLETGRFVVSDTTRICLMPGCTDAEYDAATELAEAIEKYAECKVFVERLSSNETPSDAICLRLSKPTATSKGPAKSEALGKKRLASPALFNELLENIRRSMTLRRAVVDTGLAREKEILDALAQEIGLEFVSLRGLAVTPELLKSISPTVARDFCVFPVRVTGDTIYVAWADPLHLEMLHDLQLILGKKVVVLIASETEILDAIRTHYGVEAKNAYREYRSRESVGAGEGTASQSPPVNQADLAEMNPPTPVASDSLDLKSYLLSIPIDSGESYSARIEPNLIEIDGESPAGLFYGAQTLIQLVRQYGSRLPALRIEDAPDFCYRGFMLDVSRGRVPTLDTLKWLVHALSHFKINMLQLYIEHTFHFRSHPEIGEGCSPLEPEEIVELDRYCRSRHVELVPSLQSFGHMGHILSLPKFRHLADVVRFEDWHQAPWRQRMSGMTLTPVDEGTYQLLAELYDDFLPHFSSRWFNMNSDETWDLGKGRSQGLAEEIGVGRLYFQHIKRIARLAAGHGKWLMIWADILYQHPDLIPEVPEDLVLLDWGYSHDSPFGRCRQLAEQKRPFFVCPGTSGWNQVFNDVWNAALNIRRFVAAGKQYGALGVLNTDWGDCGHFNMLGCSLHGAVLGAAMSWTEGRPDDETFDRAFSLHVFDDPKGVMGRAIRRAGSLIRQKTGKDLKTWELWTSPIKDGQPGREIPPPATKPILEALEQTLSELGACRPARHRDPLSCLELNRGVMMLESLAMRAALDHQRAGEKAAYCGTDMTYSNWAKLAELALEGIQTVWNLRSKPSNFHDIVRVFEKQIHDAREMESG